jgi:uncharacterized protein (DUF302 family)
MKMKSQQTYAHSVRVDLPFEIVVSHAHAALKDEHFGVMAEINVQKAMHEKLGKEVRPYLILGACLSPMAYQAITTEPHIGTLMPCNVCVWENEDGSCTIAAVNVETLFKTVNNPKLAEIARVINAKLEAVIDWVRSASLGVTTA